jgi:two-component system chemotaxis response regulator CheY
MSRTVLVVDDSATMRHILERALGETGRPVVLADSGARALEVLAGTQVGLVITDWNMPGMSGLDLIRAVRALDGGHDIPILVLTTETDIDKKEAARQAGATGWINKPVSPDALADITAALVA